MKKPLLILILTFFSFNLFSQDWKLSGNSKIEFKIKNAGITVDGSFSSFTTDIRFNPANLTDSYFKGSVNAKTINTGNNTRDNHLRGKDYLSVEKYPTITFTSKKITSTGNGSYLVIGDLKIKDKTKEVTMPITFAQNGKSGTFKGIFTIDRRDFGVGGWSMILSDDVVITLTINVTQ